MALEARKSLRFTRKELLDEITRLRDDDQCLRRTLQRCLPIIREAKAGKSRSVFDTLLTDVELEVGVLEGEK